MNRRGREGPEGGAFKDRGFFGPPGVFSARLPRSDGCSKPPPGSVPGSIPGSSARRVIISARSSASASASAAARTAASAANPAAFPARRHARHVSRAAFVEVVPEVARREPRVRRPTPSRTAPPTREVARNARAAHAATRSAASPAPSATALAALRNAAGDARRIAAGAARTSPRGERRLDRVERRSLARRRVEPRRRARDGHRQRATRPRRRSGRPARARFGTHCVRADAPPTRSTRSTGSPVRGGDSASTKSAALGPFAATVELCRRGKNRRGDRPGRVARVRVDVVQSDVAGAGSRLGGARFARCEEGPVPPRGGCPRRDEIDDREARLRRARVSNHLLPGVGQTPEGAPSENPGENNCAETNRAENIRAENNRACPSRRRASTRAAHAASSSSRVQVPLVVVVVAAASSSTTGGSAPTERRPRDERHRGVGGVVQRRVGAPAVPPAVERRRDRGAHGVPRSDPDPRGGAETTGFDRTPPGGGPEGRRRPPRPHARTKTHLASRGRPRTAPPRGRTPTARPEPDALAPTGLGRHPRARAFPDDAARPRVVHPPPLASEQKTSLLPRRARARTRRGPGGSRGDPARRGSPRRSSRACSTATARPRARPRPRPSFGFDPSGRRPSGTS